MRVWRIATAAPDYAADDLTGAGAKATGGRWNRPGLPVLYCADTPALACLETLVHLGGGGLPLNRYLIAIDIPDSLWKAREVRGPEALDLAWDASPASKASLDFGDDWLRSNRAAVMVVPSAIVPEDRVILINPLHQDAAGMAATMMRKWSYDPRLFSPRGAGSANR